MYDFHLGTREDVEANPYEWLLSIKRMLPRWCNGVPDSEFQALFNLIDLHQEEIFSAEKKPVLVETGCGASTIVLLYFAVKWDTQLYSWDISSKKIEYLRGMLSDTLFRVYQDRNIFQHWKYVAYSSLSKYAGIPMLGELDLPIGVSFYDSEHTWATLRGELEACIPLFSNGALVCIDDANYKYLTENTAYINMVRMKAGLPPVEIENNEGAPFWAQVEGALGNAFLRIENMEGGGYREAYGEDIFWSYYGGEKKMTASMGMEKSEELEHRFDAWRVFKG